MGCNSFTHQRPRKPANGLRRSEAASSPQRPHTQLSTTRFPQPETLFGESSRRAQRRSQSTKVDNLTCRLRRRHLETHRLATRSQANDQMTGDHSLRTPEPTVIEWSKQLAPDTQILDIAAGGGRHALWLTSLGHEVTAIDRDTSALEEAWRGAGSPMARDAKPAVSGTLLPSPDQSRKPCSVLCSAP